jgi:hypothetical protein
MEVRKIVHKKTKIDKKYVNKFSHGMVIYQFFLFLILNG